MDEVAADERVRSKWEKGREWQKRKERLRRV